MRFPTRFQRARILKMGVLSFLIHVALIVLFTLNPWPSLTKTQPLVYTVTLMAVPEPEIQKVEAAPPPKEKTSPPPEKKEPPKPPEVKKPKEKPKRDDIVEKVKKPVKKVEKPEKTKMDQEALRKLQQELEEIRKKAALDEIRKKLAQREKVEKPPVEPPPLPPKLPAPPLPKVSAPAPSEPTSLESKLSEYYNMLWTKIKEEWTLPENVLKERVDLETIIVVIIERNGKVLKTWFEKRSGNALYDQMAMRAIIKAEPMPPFPKDLTESTLEIGIRFFPE